MKYFCIGDEDTVIGFRLAGVDGRVVKTSAGAKEAFKVAVSMPDVGIVIITERISGLIREETDKFLYTAEVPLIIEIPDRLGPSPDRKPLIDIVRRAVGIKI